MADNAREVRVTQELLARRPPRRGVRARFRRLFKRGPVFGEPNLLELRYRTLVDRAPVCIQSIDRAARIEAINEAGMLMMGLPRDEAVGRSYLDLVAPADRARVATLLSQALEGRASEFDFSSADGERAFASSFIPLHAPSGEVEGLIGVTQDVTERRRAEAVLRASEERYRDLFENASEAIVTLDLDERITATNPAAEEIVGCARGELIGLVLADLVSAESLATAREQARRALAGEPDGGAKTLIVRAKDGTEIPLEVSMRAVRRNGVPVRLQCVGRDVRERLRLEAELRQAQKMEAVGRLAGGVAHDFNNLLTAITGYTDLALRSVPAGDGRLAHDLEEIAHAAERAASLTRQLLAFSRKQVLQPRALDLAELLLGLEGMLRRLIGEDVQLVLTAEPGGCGVEADPGQLQQVVLNLVVNARDAMPAGGRLTIACAPVQGHPLVRLEVADTGVGMDEAVRSRLFEPFFTTKEPGKGTGLGLATVYGIVEACLGTIAVESTLGAGTRFTIELPRVERVLSRPGVEREATPWVGDETILLVEDEEIVRALAARVLEQAGYTVLQAGSGAEALELCGSHGRRIDLLLTDVVMPGMSGGELIRRTRRLLPDTRRLVMSGYPDDAVVRRGVSEGTEMLAKPFSPEVLVRKVREILDRPAG